MNRILTSAPLVLLLLHLGLAPASAQVPASQDQPFSQAELDQMLAPVALYPDVLLSQVLMAATYPLEIVEAARWSRANPGLKGDAAVNAVAGQDWDPSVMALVAFPDLLQTMDDDLEWTRRLGDAFLYQEQAVLATVQDLRRRAEAAGNLSSGEQLRVYREQEVIYVEPAQTRIVHVPWYDPTVVYGGWWWPAFPPVYWAPPIRYYPAPLFVSPVFFWGSPVVVAPWFYSSAFDWHRRHVVVVNWRPARHYWYPPPHLIVKDGRRWHHEPKHRRGVAYSKAGLHQRYALGGASGRTAGPPARDWRSSQYRDRDRDRGRDAQSNREHWRADDRGRWDGRQAGFAPDDRRADGRDPGRPVAAARPRGPDSSAGGGQAGSGPAPVASLGPGQTTDHGYRRQPGPFARSVSVGPASRPVNPPQTTMPQRPQAGRDVPGGPPTSARSRATQPRPPVSATARTHGSPPQARPAAGPGRGTLASRPAMAVPGPRAAPPAPAPRTTAASPRQDVIPVARATPRPDAAPPTRAAGPPEPGRVSRNADVRPSPGRPDGGRSPGRTGPRH